MMWRMLPDELKGCCATFLDTPSAGRFAAACHEGQRLVLTQLVLMKLVDAVAAQVAAQAAAEAQAAPRRIAFNAAGKNFIDAYVDAYVAAAPAARRLIIDGILVAAAGHEAELVSRHWTADKVKGRLANVMKARNLAAAAAAALNHP